jgi:hypothetical protein
MGRPKNRSASKAVTISISQKTFDYLALLASRGFLGASEHDVASFIVTREADALMKANFHEVKLPKE